ncbi:MAG: hypothetical protein EPO36_12345 [Chloroflexota bacterium]|nr:MAG: hypothetical protein EPO36_12345 [Chloroflexota bacterium]
MHRARLGPALVAALLLCAAASGVPARAVEPPLPAEAVVTARLDVSPLLVVLDLEAAAATTGESVKARVRVTNAGPATVRDVMVSLRLDAAAFAIRGARQTLSQIPSGRTSTVGVTLCGRVPGAYLVLAQATLDDVTIESPAAILTILPGSGKRC